VHHSIDTVTPFPNIYVILHEWLIDAPAVDVGEWQSMDISDKPEMVTHEIQNVLFSTPIPRERDELVVMVKPNLPWAEEHFEERVGGIPVNPPPSHVHWPWAKHNEKHQDDLEKFSHTYPERFWPKRAYQPMDPYVEGEILHGIRYEYGDLGDVVDQLVKSPMTRQAYLPVWFPEDTGAVHGERVPCSLGYHFLIRDGRLNVTYTIRSCDFRRHFPDDVYLAARLGQWMCEQVYDRGHTGYDTLDMGDLTMLIGSLHVFAGDLPMMRKEAGR
jgi:hypothetical protein